MRCVADYLLTDLSSPQPQETKPSSSHVLALLIYTIRHFILTGIVLSSVYQLLFVTANNIMMQSSQKEQNVLCCTTLQQRFLHCLILLGPTFMAKVDLS